MNELWTAEIISRLHLMNVTCKQLAAECGYTPTYISLLLNGKKCCKKKTLHRIMHGLSAIEERMNASRSVSTHMYCSEEDIL